MRKTVQHFLYRSLKTTTLSNHLFGALRRCSIVKIVINTVVSSAPLNLKSDLVFQQTISQTLVFPWKIGLNGAKEANRAF